MKKYNLVWFEFFYIQTKPNRIKYNFYIWFIYEISKFLYKLNQTIKPCESV